jgi:hypothetical protein
LVPRLHYYTHRVAISNHRLLSISDSEITFRWKDYSHDSQQRIMTLAGGVPAASSNM